MPKAPLSLSDAVFIGIAAMLGAGVFVVFGPASGLAGSLLPLAILLAALVAYLNAASVSQLARQLPVGGGAYAYGRYHLGHGWGFTAGIAFLVGKIGSAAAVALTFGNYFFPQYATLLALGGIVAMAGINILGINRTALGSKIIGSITLAFLLVLAASAFLVDPEPAASLGPGSAPGVITAAALFFFAFAGYARVATLGAEVSRASRNIPLAIVISLAIVLACYLLLAAALPYQLGGALTGTLTPLADLAGRTGLMPIAAVAIFAAVAALGSLLALLAGMSRTAAAMAQDGELPRVLTRQAKSGTPWLAETLIASLAALLVLTGDVVWAIGVSAFAVLGYYAIANLAAYRQPAAIAGRAKWLNLLGLASCLVLALSVPPASIALGSGALLLAHLVRLVARRRAFG
jgi:basic amino acid/polyamine antiporter, APA family